MPSVWVSWLLLFAALVLFVLAAAGVTNNRLALVPLGLALTVLSVLVRWWPPP